MILRCTIVATRLTWAVGDTSWQRVVGVWTGSRPPQVTLPHHYSKPHHSIFTTTTHTTAIHSQGVKQDSFNSTHLVNGLVALSLNDPNPRRTFVVTFPILWAFVCVCECVCTCVYVLCVCVCMFEYGVCVCVLCVCVCVCVCMCVWGICECVTL